MILVTGASGKTGHAVVTALAASGLPVRAFVRRPSHVASLTACGATEVVLGDFADEQAVSAGMTGATGIYHICPNMHPDEVVIARRVFAAAKAVGVRRVVYHSVLHPQVEAMPHHWQKMCVEEMLFATDFDWTIVQPAAYMQNVLAYWPAIKGEGVFAVPYAVSTRLGMVILRDIAAAVAAILTQDGHNKATYELAGRESLSQTEVAAILSKELGHTVEARALDRVVWAERARQTGMSDYIVDTLLRMFCYYEQFGFAGNSFVLSHLLEREPATFAQFVRRVVDAERVKL